MSGHPPAGSDAELASFAALQARLRSQYLRFRDDPKRPYTAIFVPSQSVDPEELAKIDGVSHYEERALFNLLLLRHPRVRVVFVTSKRINPLIVDYYLNQLRGVPSEHARRRLVLLDCDDGGDRPLTAKVLERPRVVERIRDAIHDTEEAHLGVFVATPLERTLAVRLGVPLYACDPGLAELGTKSGSKEVFAAAGVEAPQGRRGLRDRTDLAEAVVEIAQAAPDCRRMVVKLEESFSGEGNAVIAAPGAGAGRPGAQKALAAMQCEAKGRTAEEMLERFDAMGGICEELVEDAASPSCQLRINPAGEVQVISTHDQVLGGPNGQIFEGATFPADGRWRLEVQRAGRAVGEELARRGVLGRFGVDFLATGDRLLALEINLRQGGTTHPFNTLKFVTDGRLDEESGRFLTAYGDERCYYATDNLRAPAYRGLLPFDLIDLTVLHGAHLRSDDTGVVFHLLGCLSEFGKLGCTAIGSTVQQAREVYDEVVALLDDVTARAG